MMKQMAILEQEKEDLRKKLLQYDSGDVKPIYQCAHETREIADLQAQVKFLQDENDTLRRKKSGFDDAEDGRFGGGLHIACGAPAISNNTGSGDPEPPNVEHRNPAAQASRPAPDIGLGRDRAEHLDDPANTGAAAAKSAH